MLNSISFFSIGLGFGFLPIIAYLLFTGHAKLVANNLEDKGACVDHREDKTFWILGGSAGYTFGLQWLFLSFVIFQQGDLHELFLGYSYMQILLSCINLVTLSWLIKNSQEEVVPVKAHLNGCGFTTAWSPFFWLFWLQKIPRFKKLVHLRDLLTHLDWRISYFPFRIFGNIVASIHGKSVYPIIGEVDHKH